MKKCNEIMTKNPVCCLPNDSVAKAAELMKSENIGSIPVVENGQTQKLVGIVTDRDLALKIIAEARDAKSTKVETVMTNKVVTCRADDDLQKALDVMAEHQLRRIPVVDHDNRIVGIIAQADVATRAGQPEKTAEMVKEISQANGK
ncbi:MAG TPA: CBS domain-containing protein [Anaerolineales bacterium]|nr:CBS domain-containing protein [Anaerolineales bacterium]